MKSDHFIDLVRVGFFGAVFALGLSTAWSETQAPRAAPAPECDPTGQICVRLTHRAEDVCQAIESLASRHSLPPAFFLRLIWQESQFDPYAISPAGALGIAQFMPKTAQLRGLQDPFNPAAALSASAAYLSELRASFGSLGLAAAAYNAGEARTTAFVERNQRLPRETRDYVARITGVSAQTWRDAPPEVLDFSARDPGSFQNACLRAALSGHLAPLAQGSGEARAKAGDWIVVIASHPKRSDLMKRLDQSARRNPVLRSQGTEVERRRLPGMGAAEYVAYVPVKSHARAKLVCQDIKRGGTFCAIVQR